MNRYQEVLSRAKEAHKIQAKIRFKFGKQIEGTRLTPLWWVSGKRRERPSRGWGVITEKEKQQHRGLKNNNRNSPVIFDGSKPLQSSIFMFRCECGKKKMIRLSNIIKANGELRKRHTVSCGCKYKDSETLLALSIKCKANYHSVRDSNGRFKKRSTWVGNNM